jgi:hypothetical protein
LHDNDIRLLIIIYGMIYNIVSIISRQAQLGGARGVGIGGQKRYLVISISSK